VKNTSLETKYSYAVRVKESKAKWKEEMQVFMTSEKWLKYMKECKRLSLSTCISERLYMSLNHSKRLQRKDRGAKPDFPDRPKSMPIAPPRPFELFQKTTSGLTNKANQALWRNLSDRQKKAFEDQTMELKKKYNLEMQKFRASEEGQEYLTRFNEVSCKKRLIRAKAAEALDKVGRASFNEQVQREKKGQKKKKKIEFKKSEIKHSTNCQGRVAGQGGQSRHRVGQTAQQIKESCELLSSSKKRKTFKQSE